LGASFAERSSVMEIHLHRLDSQTGPRDLGLHPERNAFVRLDPNHEHVLIESDRLLVKQNSWRLLEMDRDLPGPLWKSFTHAHINGHIGPAPVVDLKAERDKRFDA